VEFHGREITRKSYPQGIVLMGRAYHTWLYDGDPLKEMNFPRIISSIRNQWEKEPALFQNAVREWLLENPHRLLSVMEPSATYQEERDQKAKSRLTEIEKSLTDAQREQIRNQSEMLRKFQTEPDLPEAAAALPKLGIADISRHVETIPVERLEMGGVLLLRHDMFTNGVAYLDLAFDISDIPEDLQPLLPLLGKLTTEMGAAGLSYEDMAKRIALYTGGLGFSLVAGETADGAGSWQKMVLSVKSLYRNTTEAVAIVRDILTKGDYSEEGRMRELVFEKKNGLHSAVIPSGHAFAQMAAAMSLSLSARRSEQWHGTSQLRAITKTSATLGETRVDLVEKLGRLRDSVFTKNRLVLNMTADEEGLKRLNGAVEALLAALPGGMNVGAADVGAIEPANIGVAIPADVCYVASAFPAPPYADPLAAPLFVLSRQLSNGILYRRIRVQGGAYGGFCRYEPSNGIFAFLSYRDPHLTETLDIYREAMDDVSNNPISVDDVEKAIIGSIGALDRPLDPAGKGFTSMVREFSGMTDELRTRFRQDILDVNAARLQDAARDYFLRANREAVVAVFAPEERLLAANETLAKKLKLEKLPG
jgi:Zn-dependent M16 (insulinase) family peptidase